MASWQRTVETVRAWTVVPYAQMQGFPAVIQLHIDGGSRRVPASVGQRLLHDAVRGEFDSLSQRCHIAVHNEPDRPGACRGTRLVEELVELLQARLRPPVGSDTGVLPQYAQEA